ncbi:protein of unknown function [Taphrina deformans PYCC 5710]|uniref:Amino acid transporter transmembrane domain-containing protein n=1 Tax=Taphrina deformans (strain PYCC 5710 / ATCC 11124 / CBS 356.35 / IMI 108563 / JCM 9778 / NBRC 8474) TaxID=1097556 RepID=R4XFW8_TAPDE|nr:protein of unknown function [Taphrina deformans PYCC 5710]|eukprot:CCG84771.1 protein of unknown function [Taphrina deformans PYCC 5710]
MSDVALVELPREGFEARSPDQGSQSKGGAMVAGAEEMTNDAIQGRQPESFSAYLYYADRAPDSAQQENRIQLDDQQQSTLVPEAAATRSSNLSRHLVGYGVSGTEHDQANRAVKTATWMSAFYLLTTDVLGPYSVPFAIAQLGYGTGVILFTIMMLCAAYSAWILWKLFLKLDSREYPVINYGDLAYKIFGQAARIGCSSLQALQLWFNVGVIILVCFSVLALIWAIVGMCLGQIKTLQRFRLLASFSIWLNVICLAVIMAIVVRSAPNYKVRVQKSSSTALSATIEHMNKEL